MITCTRHKTASSVVERGVAATELELWLLGDHVNPAQ